VVHLQGAVDLGTVSLVAMSGASNTLTPQFAGGVNVKASLDSSDIAKVKSGLGSTPKVKDFLTKGELLPLAFKSKFGILNPADVETAAGGLTDHATFSFTVSFAVQVINNTAVAEVGPQAVIKTPGKVTVQSTLKETNATQDESTISKPKPVAGKPAQ